MKKDLFSKRRIFFRVLFILVWAAFTIRLFSIQVLSDRYKISSANISIREEVMIPARGVIFDRNGKTLVQNLHSFDLMVTAVEVKAFDTLLLCEILDIDPLAVRDRIQENLKDPYLSVNPFPLDKQVTQERINMLKEILFRFPGFKIQERTLRDYPDSLAAHTLGYIGEVDLKKTQEDHYYLPGDYIGISGVEKSYEEILRGKKGISKILKDKFNRNQGPYLGGQEDIEAISGQDLFLSLDAELQKYGELLMQNKIGSIVALEPSSGEILALVTSPTYNPNRLSGRARAANYKILLEDTYKPLMNRALQAQYPPGSTFKIVNALIGEQMGVLNAETRYPCGGAFHLGGLTVRCHGHASPLDLSQSIQHSCNTYYCWAFRDMIDKNNFPSTRTGFEVWRHHALSFGLGTRFNSDLPYSYTGNIPTAEHYDKLHGKNRWKALSVISLAIGQGEILMTPVQLANLAAIVANKGHYYTPHIVKAIGDKDSLNKTMMKRYQTTIDEKWFEPVAKGMRDVVVAGTARNAHIDGIAVCGKTGTAHTQYAWRGCLAAFFSRP
ncbi:MAG: penicillin-binding transpeptidase domain-containing protein, partial [Bacteroidales bacterium]